MKATAGSVPNMLEATFASMNLQDLLRSETDRIEWKRSPQDSEGLFHAVCALANDLGASACAGHVVIGIEKDGTLCGVERVQFDRIQQDIANRLRSTKIQPTPSFDVNLVDADGLMRTGSVPGLDVV